jgi:hypothetical protein
MLIVFHGGHDTHFQPLQLLKIGLQAINQNHTSNIFFGRWAVKTKWSLHILSQSSASTVSNATTEEVQLVFQSVL